MGNNSKLVVIALFATKNKKTKGDDTLTSSPFSLRIETKKQKKKWMASFSSQTKEKKNQNIENGGGGGGGKNLNLITHQTQKNVKKGGRLPFLLSFLHLG